MKIFKRTAKGSAIGTATSPNRSDLGPLLAASESSRKHVKILTFSLISALSVLSLSAQNEQRMAITHSPFEFDLSSVKQPIHFTHFSAEGSIVVEGHEKQTILIAIKDLNDDWDWEDGTAYLRVNSETGKLSIQLHGELWESDVEVFIPWNASASLKSADGEVEVRGLQGPVDCATSDGNIDLVDLTGSVSAESADGNIKFDQTTSSKNPVALSTSDGNIRLQLAPDSKAEITATIIDGKVIYDLEGQNRTVSSDDESRNKWNRLLGSQRHTVVVGKADSYQSINIHTIDGNISISNKPQHQLNQNRK